ncbi:MAG: hypothetical protein HN350_06030 [Phycisphaerales bacterium]|nr:hypothetical protein [Phycisphaerales bacterium]
MRNITIILLACACLLPLSPEAARGEGAMRVDELNEMLPAIEMEARAWARSTRAPRKVVHRLHEVWYDQGSLASLRTALETPRQAPADIFVANRLLAPMINAKPKVIAEAMGMIHTISERIAVYKELPVYTDAELKAMAPEVDAPASVKKEASKQRAEKRKQELEVQKHNLQARELRAKVFRLMVLARNREEDALLLKALVVSEKNADWMYADILEAIRSQAKKMSQARGKVLYAGLRIFWDDLRKIGGSGKKNYVDKGSVLIYKETNSKFTTHPDVAKTRTLAVINQVASAARMPALKDPKAKPTKTKPTKKPKRRKRT